MDARKRQHIALIREEAIAEAGEAWKKRIDQLLTKFASKGRLNSGATIRSAVNLMEEISLVSKEQLDSKIRIVCQNEYAFHQIETGMSSILVHFELRSQEVLKVIDRSAISQSVHTASKDLFDQMAGRIKRKVALLEFEYQDEGEAGPKGSAKQTQRSVALAPISKVGRHTAKFWDEVWAEICYQLYTGDLQPKKQADIEEAMSQIIINAGQSAAESTVRGRARIIWDKLSADP